MSLALHTIAIQLDTARRPEDVFGADPERALHAYRQLAREAHPDVNPSQADLARQVFARLAALWADAQARIARGVYGTEAEPLTIKTRRRTYVVAGQAFDGDLARLYWTVDGLLLKFASSPDDNDLLAAEASALSTLRCGETRSHPYFPELVESFTYPQDGQSHRAHALRLPRNLHSLREVLAQHGPLDPRDVTWMWRRLLVALGYAHRQGLVHGAVTPEHVLVEPEQHGLVLVDWCYSRPVGEPLKAVPPAYRAWYPDAALARGPLRPGLDIAMAARCMVALLGGDPTRWWLPPGTLHPRLAAFFGSWRAAGPDQTHDAWALNREFTDLVDDLWPRRYRPFSMPPRVAPAGAKST